MTFHTVAVVEIPIQLSNGTGSIIIPLTDPVSSFWLPLGLFIATLALAVIAFLALRSTNRNTVESLKEMKASNELTRESLRLKQMEIRSALGQPDIYLMNWRPEPMANSSLVKLFPNFKNDGKVSAENLLLNIKVFDRVVTVSEVARSEADIKKAPISIEGTLSPGASLNLHKPAYENQIVGWERTDKPITAAVWITYRYLEEHQDEVLFIMQYSGTKVHDGPNRYPGRNIEELRSRFSSA